MYPYAVNNFGDSAGYRMTASNVAVATLWTPTDGTIELGTFGTNSWASGINDSQQVVGASQFTSGITHAFLWSTTSGMVDLGTPEGGATSYAHDINNRGQAIGYWSPGGTPSVSGIRPFFWSAATGAVDLSPAVGSSSQLVDINDAGHVLGFDDRDTFLWSVETGRIDLGLHAVQASGVAMNNQGHVLVMRVLNEQVLPFVWTAADGMRDIGVYGGSPIAAGINDVGEVAFAWYDYNAKAAVSTAGGVPVFLPSGRHAGTGVINISNAGAIGVYPVPLFWCRPVAPVISDLAASPNVLQPAYGQYVTVRIDYHARPHCGPAVTTLTVLNDETGDDSAEAAIVVDAHTVRLRAARLSSRGRTYTVRIRTADPYGNVAVEDVLIRVPYDDGTQPMSSVVLASDLVSPQAVGTPITFSASGRGGTAPYAYRFWVQPPDGVWQVAQGWGTASTFTWRSSTAGAHNVTVEARRDAFVSGSEVQTSVVFEIVSTSQVDLTTTLASPQPVGTPIILMAARGGPSEYRFWVQPWGGSWQVIRDWSTTADCPWLPINVGGYNLAVEARPSASSGPDALAAIGFWVLPPAPSVPTWASGLPPSW